MRNPVALLIDCLCIRRRLSGEPEIESGMRGFFVTHGLTGTAEKFRHHSPGCK